MVTYHGKQVSTGREVGAFLYPFQRSDLALLLLCDAKRIADFPQCHVVGEVRKPILLEVGICIIGEMNVA